jgi:hypothetical protein
MNRKRSGWVLGLILLAAFGCSPVFGYGDSWLAYTTCNDSKYGYYWNSSCSGYGESNYTFGTVQAESWADCYLLIDGGSLVDAALLSQEPNNNYPDVLYADSGAEYDGIDQVGYAEEIDADGGSDWEGGGSYFCYGASH